MSSNNDYEVYRHTTIGNTLQETLDELVQSNQINRNLAGQILKEFDKTFSKTLQSRIKNKISYKGQLDTYRLCDNVWTLLFKDVKIMLNDATVDDISINRLKVVACDGKAVTAGKGVIEEGF